MADLTGTRTTTSHIHAWSYAPLPDVDTPWGARNTGYVTSTTPTYEQWRRGGLPEPMGGSVNFALPRASRMREPGTNYGTTAPLAGG